MVKITKICSKCDGENTNFPKQSRCKKCLAEMSRDRYWKNSKKPPLIKPSEICSKCGGINDRYPKLSTCNECRKVADREYQARKRNEIKGIFEKKEEINFVDDWTFSYWRYCLDCKELLPLKDFDGDSKYCKSCAEKPDRIG